MSMIISQEYMETYVIKPMARQIAELMKQIKDLDKKLDETLSVYNVLMKQLNESKPEQPKPKIIKKVN